MSHIFYNYYRSAITHPQKTFKQLLDEKSNRVYGFYAISIMAIGYTLVYAFLIFGGGQPFKPWLNIPLETYYRYNIFFCAPSMFLGWILASGVAHSLSRFVTSQGSFDQTLCLLGFSIGIASWSTAIHDLLSSFLGAIHVINQHDYEIALNSPTIWRTLLWIQMLVYLIWFCVLFYMAIRTVYEIKPGLSIAIGVFSFLIYQFFFFIFNR